jgi:hypothetical protein
MKKRIICILVVFTLWVPGIICAEDVTYEDLTYGELFFPTPATTRSRDTSVLHPGEWYIIEKIPTDKGLAIGVFLFEEGMPIEHIQSKFGKPHEIIALDVEEGSYGTILVYPHHHFFFSKTGSLQTIKERKL